MNNTVLVGMGSLSSSFLTFLSQTNWVPRLFLRPTSVDALKHDRDSSHPVESVSSSSGQTVLEFLLIGTLVTALLIATVQLGVLLLKSEQVSFSAFGAARASCVRGNGLKQARKAFGSEPMAHCIEIQAAHGTGQVLYAVKPGLFPLAKTYLTQRTEGSLFLRETCVLFPEPPGDDGDN